MKRSLSKIILSIFLAVLIGTLVPVQVYADQPTYISEMAIRYGKTLDDAKKALEDDGYTAVDGDFNKGGKRCTAVGYKTTDDVDKAITDVKVMEEDGGYSFTEYANVLAEMEDSVEQLYDNSLKNAIEEFKENYASETPAAIYAYNMLNSYTNPDIKVTDEETGKERAIGIGEMFVSDDTTDEQVKTVLLQGNTRANAGIEQYLAMACTENNWVESASDCMPVDGNITAEQSDKATNIYNTLVSFQSDIKEFEKLDVNADSTEDEIKAFLEDECTTTEQKNSFTNIVPIYNLLKETEYLDTTLYDLFMTDINEISLKKLVPLAELMTPGQVATIAYIPLYTSIKLALYTDEDWESILELDGIQDMSEELSKTTVSVYEGVDRTIFNPDGIAITNEALVLQSQNNLQQLGAKSMSEKSLMRSVLLLGVGVATATLGGLTVATRGLKVTNIYNMIESDQVTSTIKRALVKGDIKITEANGILYSTDPQLEGLLEYGKDCHAKFEVASQNTITSGSKVASVVGYTMVAIGIMISIYALVSGILDYIKSKKHPTYSRMPRIMVNQTTLSDGSYDLTYYYAAKESADELGDLNSWNGHHWIGLYYTTDKKAGKPLSTKTIVNYGSPLAATEVTKNDYRAVTLFSGAGAYNLNNNGLWDDDLSDDDKVYFYIANAPAEASTISSVFSSTGGVAGISAFGGLLVGVVATILIGKGKRKNNLNSVTTSN